MEQAAQVDGAAVVSTALPAKHQPLEVQWKPAEFKGEKPNKRYYHTAVVHRNSMYMFGGFDSDARLNDLHEFNFHTRAWRKVKHTSSDKPCRRNSHTAVYYNERMYVFGGWENNRNILNDVWEFDFETDSWRLVVPTGSPPSKRLTHTAVVHNGRMYVFGGWDGHNFLNDLFELDLTTFEWSEITATGKLPAKRNAFSAVVYRGKMCVFGGYDGAKRLNDLFEFDFARQHWREVDTLNPPEVRCYHSALIFGSSMYVFGGYTGAANMNDVQVLGLETREWKLLQAKGTLPNIRNSHTACVFTLMGRGMMFVFGGYNKGQCNDDFFECVFPVHMEMPESDLVADVAGMLDNADSFPDIEFVVEGRTIHAHRAIVAARCAYFKGLFSAGMRDSSVRTIPIDDVSYVSFRRLLQYLYSGEAKLPDIEAAQEMLRVADMYACERLKNVCEYVLKDYIDDHTSCELLHLADTYSARNLRAVCLSHVILNFSSVITTSGFEALPKSLLLEIIESQESLHV